MSAEDYSRPCHRHNSCAQVAHSTILLADQPSVDCPTSYNSQQVNQPHNAQPAHADISHQWEDHVSGMPCVRQALITSGLAVDTTDIIMASWRDNTKSKYSTYLAQWLTFCEKNGINYLQASTSDGLKYLTQVFQRGRQYGTVKAARSALSAIMPLQDGIPFGQIPTVSRFIKGVANLRPLCPHTLVCGM